MKNIKDIRIVFMGTPDFAVESLKALVAAGANIVAVVTTEDKVAGRGHKIQVSAVKKYALELGVSILQPAKLKAPEFLSDLASCKADLQIVVAFRMLPKEVWDMPVMGTFNLHGSLLPQYRGAAPLNWAIINGDKETGVTTFLLDEKIDTGRLLLNETIAIGSDDNVGDIHDRLMVIGGKLVVKTVEALINNKVEAVPQENHINEEISLKHAPKLFKENTKVDWNQTASNIHNLIRGLSPFPTAWTEFNLNNTTFKVKLFASKISEMPSDKAIGHISFTKKQLWIHTQDYQIELLEWQLPNKKRMRTDAILSGLPLNEASYFG